MFCVEVLKVGWLTYLCVGVYACTYMHVCCMYVCAHTVGSKQQHSVPHSLSCKALVGLIAYHFVSHASFFA